VGHSPQWLSLIIRGENNIAVLHGNVVLVDLSFLFTAKLLTNIMIPNKI
jgi:hypothetical protein